MPASTSLLQRSIGRNRIPNLHPSTRMGRRRFGAIAIFASQYWICTALVCGRQLFPHEPSLPVSLVGKNRSPQCLQLIQIPGGGITQRYMSSTTSNDDISTVGQEEWKDVLPFEKSAHKSATIVVPQEENPLFDAETFESRVRSTCEMLRSMQTSSVWIEIPMSRASLTEKVSSLGFQYHHAQGNVAKLNLWLREDTESKVPEYATHHVGVGAVVINSRNEVLCVRELRKNFMPWKIPGGLSELGESIAEAAVREVMEETGVPTKFKSILSFRHTHGLANGRSDLYFVCHLDPLEEMDENGNAIIPEPCAQECEIEATQWVPLTEYRAMVDGTDGSTGHPMMRNVMKIYDQKLQIQSKEVTSVVPGRKPNPMYIPVVAGNKMECNGETTHDPNP